jgi:hypothetical protein
MLEIDGVEDTLVYAMFITWIATNFLLYLSVSILVTVLFVQQRKHMYIDKYFTMEYITILIV